MMENPPTTALFLDQENEQVWDGGQCWKLTFKAFAVLRYLTERAGRLVTKEELLRGVWSDTVVSEWALTTCIREIRKTLGDDPHAPRYIETVHRRGYRFLAPLSTAQPVPSSKFQVPSQEEVASSQHSVASSSSSHPTPNTQHLTPTLVGRAAELTQLHGWLEKALNGERQIVFVTGEAGIGKTALVEAFLQSLESRVQRLESKTPSPSPNDVQTLDPRRQTLDGGLWLGRGQCIEHYGAGEAYLPVLEALGRLGQESGHDYLLAVLRQYAPTWLAQMPALLSGAELETLQRRALGVTRERMLREMAEALEALTTRQPLILWLEDLQWSDSATVDLLTYLALRSGPAQLLVIGSYRPVDVIVRGHPLGEAKQELLVHGCCTELPLELLREEAIAQYLALRFPAIAPPSLRKLTKLIHQRTEGNPLFMVNVVDFVATRGLLREDKQSQEAQAGLEEVVREIPLSIRQMIEHQLARLRVEEQKVLEGASVTDIEFSAAAVATGIKATVEDVEQCCAGLAQRKQLLYAGGKDSWPDGTEAGRYGFLHSLYRQICYERIPPGRRKRLHLTIGTREEQGYGQRAGERAAAFAVHFTQGGDYPRALHYRQQAAANAFARHAYQEASEHLTQGLELLALAPQIPARLREELHILTALGSLLMFTKGYASPDVERLYACARALCEQAEETTELFPTLWGLFYFHFVRAEFDLAHELGAQCFALAQREQDPILLLLAHEALGILSFHQAEFAVARKHLEQGSALYNPQVHAILALRYGQDVGVICLGYGALTLWELGYPQQARKRCEEALTLAENLGHPYSQVVSLIFAAWLCQVSGERLDEAGERGMAAMQLATDCGFPEQLGHAKELYGWTLLRQGARENGLTEMREGFAIVEATGSAFSKPNFLAVLAEAQATLGRFTEGLETIAQALAITDKTGERWYEAELCRLKGELLLQREIKTKSLSSAERSMRRAVSKRRTGAKRVASKDTLLTGGQPR